MSKTWIPRRWTFRNSAVAENFDTHVREQLPWYDFATSAVAFIASHYVPTNGLVYDIGAGTGNISRAIHETTFDRHPKIVSVEQSPEIAAKWHGAGNILVGDAVAHDYKPFDFGVVFLTAMFLPVETRGDFLHKLWRLTKPGGALVVVEKFTPPPGYVGTILRRMTMQWKLDGGASPEEIVAKELSLVGVQRPLSTRALPPCGVSFFRFGEFEGWLFENSEQDPHAHPR